MIELQLYSSAVLIVLSTISPPHEYVEPIIDNLIGAVKSSPSWRIRLSVLPVLQVFYFRNLLNLPDTSVQRVMDVLLECLRDENVEVRETAAKTLSGVIRCSQRQSIPLLKVCQLFSSRHVLSLIVRQGPIYEAGAKN